MAREVTFALRPAHELGMGYQFGIGSDCIRKVICQPLLLGAPPRDQDLIPYLSLLLRS
jgi:hypothetical protein